MAIASARAAIRVIVTPLDRREGAANRSTPRYTPTREAVKDRGSLAVNTAPCRVYVLCPYFAPMTSTSNRRSAATTTDEGLRPLAGAGLEPRLASLLELWRERRSGAGSHGSSRPPPKGQLSPAELAAASTALLGLQRGLTGDRALAGRDYMDDADLLGAYLLYYWPVSYLQTSIAIAELGRVPGRILDIGSGPGPGAAALMDAGAAELTLVDGSRTALAAAARLLGGADARVAGIRLDLESGAPLPSGPFDLVNLGHCINELWKERPDRAALRLAFLERCGASLAPDGALLAIEPATLGASRELLELRDQLAGRGWSILAPCPGSYPCPAIAAGPGRSCHSEAPWSPPDMVAALARAAGLDRESVKFCYFAARPPAFVGPAVAGPAVAHPTPIGGGPSPARVVSDPLLNKAGRLRYMLCDGGRLAALSAPSADPAAKAAGFFGLRRGDRITVEAPEFRESGFGIGPGTRIIVSARAPAPRKAEK
ncbi:MAG: small ribosomal subunit Rsm22 family protein [Spirochaetaceae bacterium]|nr:small ribosomal subunit Rsm22 family protein [Spirochaetaceae bacterium]